MSSLRGPGAEGVPAPASPARYPRCIALPAPSVARRSLMRVHRYQQAYRQKAKAENALVATAIARNCRGGCKAGMASGSESFREGESTTVMRLFAASKPTTFWHFVGSGGLLHLAPCQIARNSLARAAGPVGPII